MANNVFANKREVACKKADGKSICAFPDVCMTPPENPATPPGVPVPYPNTGLAKDTTAGSRTVKISGKEVMLKNKSHFKKSIGDEAGCAAKKGVVTSVNRGKVYFSAWSMDVKYEGKNVVRHLDLTTHNHASFPGNSPTWPFLDTQAFAGGGECSAVAKSLQDHCADKAVKNKKGQVTSRTRKASLKKMCADKDCRKALQCVLTQKSPNNCCPGPNGKKPTPHHVVPDAQFKDASGKRLALSKGSYSYNKAPCVCAEGNSHSVGKHGEIHGETNTRTRAFLGVGKGKQIPDQRWPVTFAERVGAEAVEASTGCPKQCVQAQLRAGHEKMGIKRSEPVRPTTAGGEAETGPPIPL
jgi:hypothetical protein